MMMCTAWFSKCIVQIEMRQLCMLLCVYLCSVPVEPEWQALPELEVDEHVVAQWWQVVEKAAESRPGLETVVVSAIVTAMHHLGCEYNHLSLIAEKGMLYLCS